MERCRPDQMAEIIRVSKRTIYRAMAQGSLDQVMVRGKVWVKIPLEIQEILSKGDRLLRPFEVAKVFQVSRSSVYRWFHEGKLSGVEVLGSLRLLESSVKAMAEERKNYDPDL